jgi:hypothetical protein
MTNPLATFKTPSGTTHPIRDPLLCPYAGAYCIEGSLLRFCLAEAHHTSCQHHSRPEVWHTCFLNKPKEET